MDYLKESEALRGFIEQAGQVIDEGLADLIENRHLYQMVSLSERIEQLAEEFKARVYVDARELVSERFEAILAGAWFLRSEEVNIFPSPSNQGPRPARLTIGASTVKTFCSDCDRSEAYNLEESVSVLKGGVRENGRGRPVQVICFVYACQSCKGVPEVFLVRREGLRLRLDGRSPIEQVTVPSVIPKDSRKYYSDAVLAEQSGQTLAGLFYLRVLVEQYACGLHEGHQVDQALELYSESLPADFKERFPSLKNLYSVLSQATHTADGDPKVFARVQRELDEHFDARRLFKLNQSAS